MIRIFAREAKRRRSFQCFFSIKHDNIAYPFFAVMRPTSCDLCFCWFLGHHTQPKHIQRNEHKVWKTRFSFRKNTKKLSSWHSQTFVVFFCFTIFLSFHFAVFFSDVHQSPKWSDTRGKRKIKEVKEKKNFVFLKTVFSLTRQITLQLRASCWHWKFTWEALRWENSD